MSPILAKIKQVLKSKLGIVIVSGVVCIGVLIGNELRIRHEIDSKQLAQTWVSDFMQSDFNGCDSIKQNNDYKILNNISSSNNLEQTYYKSILSKIISKSEVKSITVQGSNLDSITYRVRVSIPLYNFSEPNESIASGVSSALNDYLLKKTSLDTYKATLSSVVDNSLDSVLTSEASKEIDITLQTKKVGNTYELYYTKDYVSRLFSESGIDKVIEGYSKYISKEIDKALSSTN